MVGPGGWPDSLQPWIDRERVWCWSMKSNLHLRKNQSWIHYTRRSWTRRNMVLEFFPGQSTYDLHTLKATFWLGCCIDNLIPTDKIMFAELVCRGGTGQRFHLDFNWLLKQLPEEVAATGLTSAESNSLKKKYFQYLPVASSLVLMKNMKTYGMVAIYGSWFSISDFQKQ